MGFSQLAVTKQFWGRFWMHQQLLLQDLSSPNVALLTFQKTQAELLLFRCSFSFWASFLTAICQSVGKGGRCEVSAGITSCYRSGLALWAGSSVLALPDSIATCLAALPPPWQPVLSLVLEPDTALTEIPAHGILSASLLGVGRWPRYSIS